MRSSEGKRKGKPMQLIFYTLCCAEISGGVVWPDAPPEREHSGAQLPHGLPAPAHLLLSLQAHLLDGCPGGGLQVPIALRSHFLWSSTDNPMLILSQLCPDEDLRGMWYGQVHIAGGRCGFNSLVPDMHLPC